MARLIIVNEDELRRIISNAIEHSVDKIVEAGLVVELPGGIRARGTGTLTPPEDPKPKTVAVEVTDGIRFGDSATAYVIGRGENEFSYADVVARIVKVEEFDLDLAWDAIKDHVITDSVRARDSVRRSLINDDRFVKIEGRRGGWFRRIDPSQLEIQ